MKLVFTLIFSLTLHLQAASVRVGGWIPAINSMVCTPTPALDFSQDGNEVVIARCVIRNNNPFFQASFRFDTGTDVGEFGDPRRLFSSLTWHGVGGLLGQGISPPGGQNILPGMESNTFHWIPEEQSTATLDYAIEFRASWKAVEPSNGFSRIQLTTELASAF